MVTSGTWYFPLGNAEGFLRGEYIYEDEVQVIENVPEDIASRSISTINASVGLEWGNGLEVMLYGRNLTDDEYLLSAFPGVAQPGTYSGYPNQPATYGITVRKSF
jgi:iron complex outermembrane recepter protein